ncbi:ABC transporter permease [Advenella sp. FME57]|uniref:ABC transporter permease n=1 Tax=Advenella sp. FME57 TaxID=2742604 RepID=UPI001866EF98|nr:ABC transporter permease [Advenella sp. FME57]
MKNGPLSLLFNTLVTIFILAPLVIVCLVAFTPEDVLSIPTTSFSLRWFRAVFNESGFIAAFQTSLWVAFASASISAALALPAAFAIARGQFRFRHVVNGLFLSPLMIPSLVMGVALLRLFAMLGVRGSLLWLILGHVIIVTPYVIRLVLGSLVGFDKSIEHAAESLGAGKWTVFRRITFPLILPGIFGGWILAFINSFDELTMSVFLTSPTTITLPVKMYMYATESINPMLSAVSALIIVLTAITMFVLDRVYGLDKILIGKQ